MSHQITDIVKDLKEFSKILLILNRFFFTKQENYFSQKYFGLSCIR